MTRKLSLTAALTMLVACVGMARAEGSLEAAKETSGIEFGEMAGLNGRGDSSAVNASGGNVRRPALTAGKLDRKALKGNPEIPNPADAYNDDSDSGQWGDGKPAGLLGIVLGTAAITAFWAGLGFLFGGAGAAVTVAAIIFIPALMANLEPSTTYK